MMKATSTTTTTPLLLLLLGLLFVSHYCHAFSRTTTTTMMMAATTSTPSPEDNNVHTKQQQQHQQQQQQQQQQHCTLYDMPVSNNGARCRIILYTKGLTPAPVRIAPPTELGGGLFSDEYRRVNPTGKMPALTISSSSSSNGSSSSSSTTTTDDNSVVDELTHLGESDTIARYLLTKYKHVGPSFLPDNPRSNWIARLHDMYLTTIQGALYKAAPPFGTFGTRVDAITEYVKQLQLIESLMIDTDNDDSKKNHIMYLCGKEISLADATLFPSLVFCEHMFPKFECQPQIPSKLLAWYQRLKVKDDACRTVYQEMQQALQSWDAKNRWDSILGAGWRDDNNTATAPATVFDQILAKQIPAHVVYETDKVIAFRDIHPAGPAHVLVIPKLRNGLTRLKEATAEHTEILGLLMVAAAEVSRQTELGFGDGARIVINDGPDGGQEVMHLHVHVIGGRSMQWPPG